MMFESERGNEAAALTAMERAQALAPDIPEHQRILRYNIATALFMLGRHADAEEMARELVKEYFELLGLTPVDIIGLSNRKIAQKLTPSPSLHNDLKHLADALDVVARSSNAQGRHSGLARVHAAKFYSLANAVDSFVKVSQDLVDEFVRCSDYVGARQVIEQNLLPEVIKSKMLNRIISVRSQYAVVLGYCGEYEAADAEFARLDSYLPGLTSEQHAEIEGQREMVAKMRLLHPRSRMLHATAASLPRKMKVRRNDPCPCGSGQKYKRCHGAA